MGKSLTGQPLKHLQVRDYVRSVCEGAEPGTPAPSERELVVKFGVARMTVRQAVDALVAEGLLERVHGRGTFVARPRRKPGRLTSFTEEATRRGMLPSSRTLVLARQAASASVARALAITEGDPVIHWRRVRCVDGVAASLEDTFLSEVLLPGFLLGHVPDSLYAALAARGLRPEWAEDVVSAVAVEGERAALLEVEPGTPVLRLSRRALAAERPVQVARCLVRPDRFPLVIEVAAGD